MHRERGKVYSNPENSETFADSLERHCRLKTHHDEDDDYETVVKR